MGLMMLESSQKPTSLKEINGYFKRFDYDLVEYFAPSGI